MDHRRAAPLQQANRRMHRVPVYLRSHSTRTGPGGLTM